MLQVVARDLYFERSTEDTIQWVVLDSDERFLTNITWENEVCKFPSKLEEFIELEALLHALAIFDDVEVIYEKSKFKGDLNVDFINRIGDYIIQLKE